MAASPTIRADQAVERRNDHKAKLSAGSFCARFAPKQWDGPPSARLWIPNRSWSAFPKARSRNRGLSLHISRRLKRSETAETNSNPRDNRRACSKTKRFLPVCLSLPPQPCSDEVYGRCDCQDDPVHLEFPKRRMREDPDDRNDRERGNYFHSWEIEAGASGFRSRA